MKKIIITAVLTGVLVLTACAKTSGEENKIRAINGLIDLSGQDFNNEKIFKLDGEWEFYWNRLFTPADFSSDKLPAKTGNITVPSYWNKYDAGSGPLGRDGFATYRLKVKIKETDKFYALRLKHMYSAYTLWIDDKIAASNGTVGKSIETMTPQFLPKLVPMHTHSNEIQIVLQISNFYHTKSGFTDSISIGYEDVIRKKQLESQLLEIFLFGVLIIMFLYFLALYIMMRRDRTFLYFSLVCLVFALRILFLGERLVINFFPLLNWEFCEKVSFLSIFSGVMAGNLYLYWLLIKEYSKKIKNLILIIGAVFSIFVILSYSRIYWNILYLTLGLIIIWIIYSLSVVLKAIIRKREGIAFLAFGLACTFLAAILEILFYLNILNIGNVTRYGLFIFIIMQALMLSYRYSLSFEKVEALSREKTGLFTNAIQIISSLILDTSTRLYEKTQNVTRLSEMMAHRLGYNSEKVEEIKIASLLHDIGMIGVQSFAFDITRKLNEDEKRMIENHPKRSIDIIRDLKEMEGVIKIIEQHHESYDGSGYPAGIRGNRISTDAMIIRIADDFFDLLAIPDYQEINRKERIIKYFENRKGIIYNPELIDEFISLINDEKMLIDVHIDDISLSNENGTYVWKMPTAMHMENLMVSRVLEKLRELIRIDDGTMSSIEFSLGEVIRNAIIHGNKYDTEKAVTVKLNVSNILLMVSDVRKIEISVADEGEGMDFNDYNNFKQLRTDLAFAIRSIKEQKDLMEDGDRKEGFSQAIRNLEQLQLKYFFDFNSYMQKKTDYSSGGVGLLYVLRMFDNVEFRKITDSHRVCGMEVIMEKYIPA